MNLLAKHQWYNTSVEAEFHKRLGFLSKKHQGMVMHHFREVLRNQLREPSLKEIVADLAERAGTPLADPTLSVLDQPIEGMVKANGCTEPNREACPRRCMDFCNAAEQAHKDKYSY